MNHRELEILIKLEKYVEEQQNFKNQLLILLTEKRNMCQSLPHDIELGNRFGYNSEADTEIMILSLIDELIQKNELSKEE